MSGSHPITDSLEAVHAALDDLGEAQALYLSPDAKKETLRAVVAAEARLASVRLTVLAVADDVAEETGAKDAGSWLAADQRLDRRAARTDHRLAASLDGCWSGVAHALRQGALHLDQARVIVRVLDDLAEMSEDGSRIDPVVLAEAEQRMIIEAKNFNPSELARLGRRLLEVVDPAGAEAREARKLADTEACARQKQQLSLRRLGDGTTRISGLLPDMVAHRLSTYLDAFAQPRKQALAADGRLLPRKRLLAMALGDLLERIDPDHLPDHGGDTTTIVVTIDHDSLTKDLAIAGLGYDPDGDDLHLTASQVRRLACQAHLLPMVLNGGGEILDVGRRQRLHTPAMRKAVRMRDRTCRAHGCDIPAPWCEVHHLTSWAEGGDTRVDDAVLLCSHHHHVIHDPAYHHERHGDGTIRYYRRR